MARNVLALCEARKRKSFVSWYSIYCYVSSDRNKGKNGGFHYWVSAPRLWQRPTRDRSRGRYLSVLSFLFFFILCNVERQHHQMVEMDDSGIAFVSKTGGTGGRGTGQSALPINQIRAGLVAHFRFVGSGDILRRFHSYTVFPSISDTGDRSSGAGVSLFL
jgi:hypothetical protein